MYVVQRSGWVERLAKTFLDFVARVWLDEGAPSDAPEVERDGRFTPDFVPLSGILFSPSWRTDAVMALASRMYESRDFSAMPVLADALQDAGCDNHDILSHCRAPGPHVRGCWVVDLVLGKE